MLERIAAGRTDLIFDWLAGGGDPLASVDGADLVAAGAVLDQRDAHGDSPLSWASWGLRDTAVLCLLQFPPRRVNPARTSMAQYLIGDADMASGKQG